MTARPKQTSPAPAHSLTSYCGLVSRVCDALRLTPSVIGQDRPKCDLEFDALAVWCAEKMNAK